jgi:signal transduction histidine kinase
VDPRRSSSFLALRFGFRAKIDFILGLGLAILVAVGLYSYRSIDALVQSGRDEGAALAGQAGLEQALGALRQAESAQRKYLLSGNPDDLAAYRQAAAEARAGRHALRDFPADDQPQVFAQLGQLLDTWLDRVDAAAELRRQGRAPAKGQSDTAELERRALQLADALRAGGRRALRNSRADTAYAAGVTAYFVLWGTAFACALLLWAMVVIHRYQARREEVERGLREVDRLKSEFITTVSHELRTPLTSVRGSLGLLAGGVAGPLSGRAGQLIGIAMDNCERLVRLVNDILDSEKILAGKMPMKLEILDLAELTARALRESEGYASTHGVKLVMQDEARSARVSADRDRLLQVLVNLLSNACKYSPRGGSVEVRLERVGPGVRVSVADRGPGVPPEFQPRLFQRFSQLDSVDSRRKGGSGLGLSICRGIVERLGGHLGYRPREGGGSVFFFELATVSQPAEVETMEKTA